MFASVFLGHTREQNKSKKTAKTAETIAACEWRLGVRSFNSQLFCEWSKIHTNERELKLIVFEQNWLHNFYDYYIPLHIQMQTHAQSNLSSSHS